MSVAAKFLLSLKFVQFVLRSIDYTFSMIESSIEYEHPGMYTKEYELHRSLPLLLVWIILFHLFILRMILSLFYGKVVRVENIADGLRKCRRAICLQDPQNNTRALQEKMDTQNGILIYSA